MATQTVGRAGIGSDGPFQNLLSSSVLREYSAPDILLRTLSLLVTLFARWYERKGKVNELESRLVACEEHLARTRLLLALLALTLFVLTFVPLRSR